MMRLAGLDITDDCTLELVKRLRRAAFEHQADTIEEPWSQDRRRFRSRLPIGWRF
jgi:hypothetical protein